MNIDWNAVSSHILINPCYSLEEQTKFKSILNNSSSWPDHLWVSTSGSTVSKWVGLSKQAILISAQAVNSHLQSNANDIWIHALPDFHVGGVGIWARSFLSGAKVFDFKMDGSKKWDPFSFYKYVSQRKGTLSALVPAQLHDLVQLGFNSPPSLRAVIVGGGALSHKTYFKAVQLGWKILPSYGMTECASQVATAALDSWQELDFPHLKLLPHVQASIEGKERIKLKSLSLLSTYAIFSNNHLKFMNPKQEEWFLTEDRGSIHLSDLYIFGRLDELIKIGGESVDFNKLECILRTIQLDLTPCLDMALVAFPDERLGYVIHLVIANGSSAAAQSVIDLFQQRVMPFEKIRHVHYVSAIPRSSLSKILKNQLLNLILHK